MSLLMKFIRRFTGTAVLLAGGLLVSSPRMSAADAPWHDWQFLVGTWEGEGTGAPGRSAGGFTFAPELGDKALVRRSHADYPAAAGRPAFSHEDLTIVYAGGTHADYYDSEGHVIRYKVTLDTAHAAAIFLSDPSSSAPQFRLSYQKADGDRLAVKFEIAPPGRPFSTYVDGVVHRK